MASNKIQIKRSTANAVVTALANGELAYTQNSHTLWIGLPDGSGVEAIGGQRIPGVLTANQALVANSTSGINRVLTANVDVLSFLNANGSPGSSGYVLMSSGAGANLYWSPPGAIGVNVASQYVWSNNHTFLALTTFGANLVVDNTSIRWVGNTTSSPTLSIANNGVIQSGNTTSIAAPQLIISNSSGITTVNADAISTTTMYANVSGVYMNVGGQTNTGTLYVATSANVGSYFSANSTVVNHTVPANSVSFTVGANFIANSTVATHSGTVNASSLTVGSAFVANSSAITTSGNVAITGANVDATSALLRIRDITVTGNLVVSGTVVTFNTSTLTVNDNIIEVGLNNTTNDTVDTGFFSPAGNSTAVWYSGIARIAALSSNTNPVFRVFVSNSSPNTASTIEATANTKTGTLMAYLQPYGAGGGFVSNATNISIVANSTLAVAITANTLTLATPLAVSSGGLGITSIASQAIPLGNSSGGYTALSFSTTAGTVLQSNGTALVYDTLDGGTF